MSGDRVAHEFKTQEELNEFQLAMQWPEDRERFLRLITPIRATVEGRVLAPIGDEGGI